MSQCQAHPSPRTARSLSGSGADGPGPWRAGQDERERPATPLNDAGSSSPAASVGGISVAPLRTLRAIRVESAVGRGRSRPLIVEAEDGHTYVAKLNHSEKTARRLIVEVIAGQIASVIGLPQPEIALVEIDPAVEGPELLPEKREELDAARGPAFGSLRLPDAVSLRRKRDFGMDAQLAAAIVWFDSLMLNHDRKDRNPNILISGERAWMIDNDSALAIHHRWVDAKRQGAYAICPESGLIWWDPREHVLLPMAGSIAAAGDELAGKLSRELIQVIVDQLPERWIQDGFPSGGGIDPRQMYVEFLAHRLSLRRDFEQHADHLRVHGVCAAR